ncbi:hypothetical protein AgCh_002815 [Apium graveolens]
MCCAPRECELASTTSSYNPYVISEFSVHKLSVRPESSENPSLTQVMSKNTNYDYLLLNVIANALLNRQPGTLPSDTEVPGKREAKEQVKAITLRSRKVANPEKSQVSENKVMVEEEVLKDVEVEPRKKVVINTPPKGNTGEKQMPSYAKFMKGILSRKVKLDDLETVALTEECSAVLQQKLPTKRKDPGNFTIPCTIGNLSFNKCLCDLRASINLMPLSIFKKLGLPDPKPTYMSLQLADHSITYTRDIIEDVLVKVGKLIFHVDFVILDFEEYKKIPILLGRPFLATG